MANKKSRTQKSKTQKNQIMHKFFKIFLMVFAIMMLLMGLLTLGYTMMNREVKTPSGSNQLGVADPKKEGSDADTNNGSKEDLITTIAVFGVDEDGYRTDVVMLAFFNRVTMAIDIVSIPRDTYIALPDAIYETMKARRSDTPKNMRINEVPAYAEPALRHETSVAVIESVFGVQVDYYAAMDLRGFVSIVDLVGPVIMDIPLDMNYHDPYQDLYIDVKAGDQQEINGAMAEGIVRYRSGYRNADIGRIGMQHQFMQAFMKQLLTLENRLNIVNIAATALLYLDTDFVDALDYVTYMDAIDLELMTIQTLPGEVKPNTAYYSFDYEVTKTLFNQIINFNHETVDEDAIIPDRVIEPVVVIDTALLAIHVENGTNISGLAGRTKTALEAAGYQVAGTGNYENRPLERTYLRVPTEAVGIELAAYLSNPEIRVEADLLEQAIQVYVILGGTDGETY